MALLAGDPTCDDVPEPACLRVFVLILVGVGKRAQGKATGQMTAFVEMLAGSVEAARDLPFERASILDGRRGPVLQRGRLAIGFPDMFAANQRATCRGVQAVWILLPEFLEDPCAAF